MQNKCLWILCVCLIYWACNGIAYELVTCAAFGGDLLCGICFFCLDVGCRRRVVLRYGVNVCVKYMSMDTLCVCVLDILGMQFYRL